MKGDASATIRRFLLAGALIMMTIVGGGGCSSNPECEAYEDKITEDITVYQMVDKTLGFFDALDLACQTEGPPPPGCNSVCS